MKKLMLLILILSSFSFASKLEKTLQEFAHIVAEHNQINILISNDVEPDKFLFIVPTNNNQIMLPAFERMLYLKGLELIHEKGFYYIDTKKEPEKEIENEEEKRLFYVPLGHVVFEDIATLLSLYEGGAKYIKNTNSLVLRTTLSHYEQIKQTIAKIDAPLEQIQFKITVLETSLNELKDRGSQLSAYMQSVDTSTKDDGNVALPYSYFLNLITMPYSATSNVVTNSKQGFYGVLKYLNQNGFTTIQNSPILTARSQSKVTFSSVKNIPYLTQSNEITEAKQSVSNSYEYKDVGLKITILPIVLGENVNFSLGLTIEDVLTSNTLTPTTSKKELTSDYTLKKGELLVLSGINRTETSENSYGIPLLKDIWFLGNLFQFKTTSHADSVITITIEVL